MSLVETIDQVLGKFCKTSLRVAFLSSLVYTPTVIISYNIVDSNYRIILEENKKTNLIVNYNNILNPIEFYQDNHEILERGSIILKNKELGFIDYFGVCSITGG